MTTLKKIIADKNNKVRNIVNATMKNKALVITATKMLQDKILHVVSVTLDGKAIKDLQSAKTYHEFRNKIARVYHVQAKLFVDSSAKKLQLAQNTAYDNTTDAIARIIKNSYRVVDTRKRLQSLRKKTVKKTTNKKTVKAKA